MALVDPYAAIRALGAGAIGFDQGFSHEGESGVQNYGPSAYIGDELQQILNANGYQSKYNNVLDLGDGRVVVTMQAPGGHKYDTLDVVYRRAPDGGFVMEGDPTPTRQVSSLERWRDTAEAFAPMAAMALGGAMYGAGGGAGGAASSSMAEGGILGAGAEATGGMGVGGAAAGTAGGITAGDAAGGAAAAGSAAGGSSGGAGTPVAPGDYWSQFQNWLSQNPNAGRAIAGLIGAGLTQAGGSGGGGGGYQDSGYRPTISRGGWSPSVQPAQSTQPRPQMLGTSLLGNIGGQSNDGLWRYRGLLGGAK